MTIDAQNVFVCKIKMLIWQTFRIFFYLFIEKPKPMLYSNAKCKPEIWVDEVSRTLCNAGVSLAAALPSFHRLMSLFILGGGTKKKKAKHWESVFCLHPLSVIDIESNQCMLFRVLATEELSQSR